MGNTLCIYDGDVQTRQIACLVGSVLSMSAYAAYTETMNWDRYRCPASGWLAGRRDCALHRAR